MAHSVCMPMVLTDAAQNCLTISSEMSEKNDSIILEEPITMKVILYITTQTSILFYSI
jgi:hypothetical protein